MTRLGDWRQEIKAIDEELFRLVNHRSQLAIEILRTLRAEISLGEVAHDSDRLMLLIGPNGTPRDSCLMRRRCNDCFQSSSKECRRIAEGEISSQEHNRDVDLSISDDSKRRSIFQR